MLQHYWNVTIRWFNVMSRIHFEEVVLSYRYAVDVLFSPRRLALSIWKKNSIHFLTNKSSSSSSSSRHAACTYSAGCHLLSVPIVHLSRQVFQSALSFCWLANTGVSMCWNPLDNAAYEPCLTSLTALRFSCSYYVDS